MSEPRIEAFLEMLAVERDASPHTLAAYGRDLADAAAGLSAAGGLLGADLGRASNTVGRPCGSLCVVSRPTGL